MKDKSDNIRAIKELNRKAKSLFCIFHAVDPFVKFLMPKLVLEPEWTRVRPSLDQKSVIDFIVTDVQLMRESGEVNVDSTDIGVSDHFLVWLELGRVAKCCRKQKRTIRKWRLDR